MFPDCPEDFPYLVESIVSDRNNDSNVWQNTLSTPFEQLYSLYFYVSTPRRSGCPSSV